MTSSVVRLGSCAALCRNIGLLGRTSKNANSMLDFFSDVNNVVSCSLKLTSIHTHPDSDNKRALTNGINFCSDVSGILNTGKCATKWGRLLSGEMIFSIKEDGSFDRDIKTGRLVVQPTLRIASNIFGLASKTLSVANFGYKKNLWTLGKHANTISLAADATDILSTATGVLDSSLELREIIKQGKASQQKVAVRSLACSILRDSLDLASAPFDVGIVGGAASSTIGCSLSLLGSVLGIVNVIFND